MKIKSWIIISFLFMLVHLLNAQKNVAITIDDIPNTVRYEKDRYQSLLLQKLDSLCIPIAIFINEGLIYKGDSITRNFELLNNWIGKKYMTIGNHTFSHTRYSTVEIDSFKVDILKGACITTEIAKKYNKSLRYFRFPYNDLGKDSLQNIQIKEFLLQKDYQVTPFTIESIDWMYSKIYEYYLDNEEQEKALEVGKQYVDKTLEYFEFFDVLSKEKYGRSINQIYLCHDNKLNATFLDQIIDALAKRNYDFVSLDEALNDKAYEQEDKYFKKWGISWIYRWQSSQKERIEYMKKEPSTTEIETLFKTITKEPDTY